MRGAILLAALVLASGATIAAPDEIMSTPNRRNRGGTGLVSCTANGSSA